MNALRLTLSIPLMLLFLSHFGALYGHASENKGLDIAIESDRFNTGWGSLQSKMTMILTDSDGRESRRTIRNKALEVQDDGDKTLVIFDSPSDIKGTTFLSFSHSHKSDEQWLYMPSLNRVKRISSANQSGSFMGSEFAYEDISSAEVDKYLYKWISDENLGSNACFVVERYPKYKKSGYSRQIVWFDKEHYQPLKIEYYDRKDSLLKSLELTDYDLYENQFWRAREMHMVNHQSGKETTLQFSDYEFSVGLSERDFHKGSLERSN